MDLRQTIRRILREEKKTKSTNKEFVKYKDSKFHSLRDFTLQDIVDNWELLSDHKNDNIKTIKYFINNPDKITDLVYDEQGLEDGFHRLIAAKILKKPRFTYRMVENLQESIRRTLREDMEDFIALEDLYLNIKDYDGGFDVFIMSGNKKIGQISFAEDDRPNQYTIVDATINDEFKGNRIYSKTIINLFKERPNIIINSVFRSPEAEKAWKHLLSNLPSNIEHKVKHYEDEDTTLYQLKLKNLQETIRRILREEVNTTNYIRRRYNCMDEYITKLENGEETLPIRRGQLDWTNYQIMITAFIRSNCEDDNGYYDPNLHSNIMDIFGDRLYQWYYKNNIKL